MKPDTEAEGRSRVANYTPAIVMEAEGSRVGFATCTKCGAAVLIDPRGMVDAMTRHNAWHARAETPSPTTEEPTDDRS